MINGEKYLPRVPSEYQEVAYLQNSGTQYIDTGLIGTDLYDCEIELIISNESDLATQYNFNGAYKSGFTTQLGLVATSATECRASMNFGFSDAVGVTGLSNHQFHTLYLSDGLQKVDNIQINTVSYGTASSLHFFLFAREQETAPVINYCPAMKLKAFSVRKNGPYIRNMIPVRRITDSVLGLYDIANDVFYTNQGTGTFTAGADVSPWHDTPIPTRKLHNKTDVITSLPVNIYTDGQPIGANLWNYTFTSGYNLDITTGIPTAYGNQTRMATLTPIDISAYDSVAFNFVNTTTATLYAMYSTIKNGTLVNRVANIQPPFIVDVSNADEIYFCIYNVSSSDTISNDSIANVMLNSGSSALPYQPYAPTIIKGNMQQTGTPTPSSPITPSECGEMSSNLVNIADFTTTVEPTSQDKILWTGNLPVGTYTFSINQDNDFTSSLRNTIHIKIGSTSYYENATGNYHNNSGRHTYTFTVSDSSATVTIYYWTNTISNECSFSQAMLNSGSIALPYDKYGQYKIPISSSGKNLFDISTQTVGYFVRAGNIGPSKPLGNIEANASYNLSAYIEVLPNTQYTIKYPKASIVSGAGLVYYNNETTISGVPLIDQGQTYTFTTPDNCNYIRLSYDNTEGTDVMLNLGSTALPYEPYRTTTPVYLGEIQTTRKVKKYEFTGQEADLRMQLVITATNAVQAPTTISDYKREPFICSHMEVTSSSGASSTHGFYGQELTLCFDFAMGLDTLEKVRTYLQQQYAAGTPVCVWYVLATETTSVVNEPLRKIGDYADSVTASNIPTTAGGIEFDVDTSLKPSEVSLTYHGWHDISPLQRENGEWV